MSRVRLEVCVDTHEGLEVAAFAGADRIELCSCLSAGGLTPSIGMIQAATSLDCPTRVMIRPRDGDFTYASGEIDMMLRDMDAVATHGLEGVVLGANHSSGHLDEDVLSRLVRHATGMNLRVTLHRSFDLAPDPFHALEVARNIGIAAILTSGGELDAMTGAERLQTLVAAAGGIEIMAGVGVGAASVADLVSRTNVTWVHGSCSLPRQIVSQEALRLGYSSPDHRRTDPEEIRRILNVLTELAHREDTSIERVEPRDNAAARPAVIGE